MTRFTPLLALLSGCLSLDGFVYNPVHCTTVGKETCTAYDNVWDDICVPCEEPYDWERDYPWMEGTLEADQTIRPIPQDSVEQLAIETRDGEATLDAYWIPSHGENPDLAGLTVVYSHGNFAGIEHYQPRVRMLHEWGVNVLVWDYRGYGKSMPEGVGSAEQFLADARQVRKLADELAPDRDRVLVYAYSIGGIPAVEMAASGGGCALFMESAWISVSTTTQVNTTLTLGEQFLSEGLFDNVAKIAGYDGPVFAMLGDRDRKFTVEETREFLDAAPGKTELWVLKGVDHGISTGGVPEDGLTEYLARMDGFLADKAPGCLP